MEERELNYKDKTTKEAIAEFEEILEEFQGTGETQDFVILTNDHETQGALLEIIDNLDLDHRIELGGKVYVTVE